PLSLTSKRFHEFSYPEFYALFVFMVAGLQFMVTTDNLILIFVGIETSSLALYALIAMHNRSHSFEAAIKYFTMGAVAAGFYAMGSAAIYATTGSIELWQISEALSLGGDNANMLLIAGGAILLLVAFAFKLSLFPFHTWAPDVYEGASAPLAGYMSIVPKVAAFAVALRIFSIYIDLEIDGIQTIILILSVATMTLANIMALVQEDVKRMLAYSSISHAGFVMAAIAIGTTKASTAIFVYYALFMFTNLGAFTMLWISRHKVKAFSDRFDHPYEKFAGMIKIVPMGAVVMALFMLSLAGVPPFSVFWGKLYIMSSAIDAGYIKLAIIMGLNSAIAAYYYLKLIVFMFLREPVKSVDIIHYNISRPLMVVVGIAVLATVGSVFFFDKVLTFVYTMMSASGF
ncbi:MAG: NADH-quinone oxidoreductase subunit NuoN, partial [Epsilonproteobacteria bacterium]|nr:NADH-quinone oxidoreductase subunit NuoN [Campylobacterota bacterium]